LRGRVLRTELYARDGSPRQDRPYTVTEALHGVCEVTVENGRTRLSGASRPNDGATAAQGDLPLRIFFPHALAQRTTQWERGDDPMSEFTFTGYYGDVARGDYDPYGRQRSEIRIAVPRGRRYLESLPPGAVAPEPYLATHVLTDYAERDDAERYIVDRVARATSYEIANDGRAALLELQQRIASNALDDPALIFAQTLNFYDGDVAAADGGAFVGLPLSQLGNYGALTRRETLILTERIIEDAYRSGDAVANPPERPPYLTADAAPAWTGEYPQEFRDRLPPRAGFIYQAGAGSAYAGGYYAASQRTRYDFHADPAGRGRGLTRESRDPLGNNTTSDYDAFDFVATKVTDAAGLAIAADYDYRVFQPRLVTSPNGNRTLASFTPLGMLRTLAVMGKEGDEDGDTAARPGTIYQYDFLAFLNGPPDQRQPISVRIDRRIDHFWDSVHAENARRQQNGQPPLTPAEVEAMFPSARADGFPELAAFPDRFLQSRQYTDGFGRLLQTRAQSEDLRFGDPQFGGNLLPPDQGAPDVGRDLVGRQNLDRQRPNVIVSGWQRYDNKGQVVEKYQPFFDSGWDCASARDDQLGQKAAMFYDARGRLVRTVNPDGSEERAVYGTPLDLEVPDEIAPTPWVSYRYDANDNAGRTHPDAARRYQHHWNTPTSTLVDALGRAVEVVERNRAAPALGAPQPAIEEYRTTSSYDIRGNRIAVWDPLDRLAFAFVHDLSGGMARASSADGGAKRTVRNATGNVVEERDSKGALTLRAWDRLNRADRLWARDDVRVLPTLRVRTEYGDAGDPAQPAAERAASRQRNRLAQRYQAYDEAGLQVFERFDFKGNGLEKSRQAISDAAIASVFEPAPPNWQIQAFRVNWQPPAGTTLAQLAEVLLDATTYRTTLTYDALSRVTSLQVPQDVTGARPMLAMQYDRAGALAGVSLDGAPYVTRVVHDANGQRTLIAYGNGKMTRYAYDARSLRLSRLRTETFESPIPSTYRPVGPPLQDFAYDYDLAGNLLGLHDRTGSSGVPNTPLGSDALDRSFAYDPLYRLLSATGRECDTPSPNVPWDDSFRCRDPNRTRNYTEIYTYDAASNLTRLSHRADAAGSFDRQLAPVLGRNRLAGLTVAGNVFAYAYDDCGNLVDEGSSRHFEWDHGDRMRVYRTQTPAAGAALGDPRLAEPSVHAHYLYDEGGRRVKKLVRRQGGGIETTVYIDSAFERVRLADGQANDVVHLTDDRNRIATLRIGAPFPNDNTPATKYQFGDHLGSSNVVVDDVGATIDREEYTPYGETSFGSAARKRYRYVGKERDEENGLYYHGARYSAPWLARWVSCDPIGLRGGLNPYRAVRSNPMTRVDKSGAADTPTQAETLPDTISPVATGGSTAGLLDLPEAPYSSGGGHHPIQGAMFRGVGQHDPFYSKALAISQKSDSYLTPELHKCLNEAQRQTNRALWSSVTGDDVVSSEIGPGRLTITSLGAEATRDRLNVGQARWTYEKISFSPSSILGKFGLEGEGRLAPTATPWLAETQAYFALRAIQPAELANAKNLATNETALKTAAAQAEQTLDIVSRASQERQAAGSNPVRIPNAPRGSSVASSFFDLASAYLIVSQALNAYWDSRDFGYIRVGPFGIVTDPGKLPEGTVAHSSLSSGGGLTYRKIGGHFVADPI
ncbi:MAG: hypothetical protein JO339_18190, partial [Alphaproteobacteria bacterium]|nr:hypothetical protein [Alphaproteobacteria bacterium]